MPELSVPWGRGELPIALPEHWRLEHVATPELRAAPKDWADRMGVAISKPIAGMPLAKLLTARRSGRILLVVEDITRHSPLPKILEIILREIRHARIGNDQLEIVFATGMHPPVTDEQAALKLGAAAAGIRWRSNPWKDDSQYADVGSAGGIDVSIDRGVAQADLRIVISSVSPHLQAGFGGGHKMFLPGCASLETIRNLHRLGIGHSPRQLVGTDADDNQMRSAIDAGGRLIDARGKTFAVQYILDEDDLPTSIATGEVIPAQRMLAKQCAVACGIVTGAPADVLIANAHPRDFDLWQSMKCIANTRWAARDNGVIICLARCEAGINVANIPAWPLSSVWTRRIVRWLGPQTISSLIPRIIPRLAGDAAFFIRLATEACYRNPILIVSESLHAAGAKFPGIDIFGDFSQAVAAAETFLDDRPQRVVVFPSGGITFPVLAPRPGTTSSPVARRQERQ